ncbi:MAG: hypothetical protein NVSMB6_17730 [Burkholderiaceae bacterium]
MNPHNITGAPQRIAEESGGALDIYLITQEYFADLLIDSVAGNKKATQLLKMILDCATTISQSAKTKRPQLCLCCPAKLTNPADVTFLLTLPSRPDPSLALGAAICPRCMVETASLQPKVLAAISRVFPGGRPFVITHETGGRA